MNQINKLHTEAMNFAEQAAIAKVKGSVEQANTLFHKAYRYEAKAALKMNDSSSLEPTRSVLFRSAASLAIDCNELRQAEKLIAIGLAGNPPSDIAEEFRDLFERVNFHRHLNLHGIILEEEQQELFAEEP